jgi:hypothetical protein
MVVIRILDCDVDQAVRLLFHGILVLVLFRCARARSLSIAAQMKIMGETSLVFTGFQFDIYAIFYYWFQKNTS